MREILNAILNIYPSSRTSLPFGGQHDVWHQFENLKNEIATLESIKNNSNLVVKYSYGKGNWAETPWLAILNVTETKTTQRGVYVVFIFRSDGDGCYLKFAQGVTDLSKDYGSGARAVSELQRRAAEIRALFPEMQNTSFKKEADQPYERRITLGELYEASTIYSKYYQKNSIPSDELISNDIQVLLDCYEKYLEQKESKIQKESPILQNVNHVDHPSELKYTFDEALDDLFMSRTELENIIDSARIKKNIILQGPPGVGKTFISRRIAYLLIGQKAPSNLEFIQFHQSYSYEDFVQGWRPSQNGGFIIKNGSFFNFCEKARLNLEKQYVFIIDEINRGNLSKIFGELLMLIEGDKRGDENSIKLTYSESDDDRFSVPHNVYIIGLMNTADRSLALVDYALRRRFSFFDIKPMFESKKFEDAILSRGGSIELLDKIRSRIGALNRLITNERRDLGAGYQIGHSYFCPAGTIVSESQWYSSIIKNEIRPLIQEYWFDMPEKVDSIVEQLIQ